MEISRRDLVRSLVATIGLGGLVAACRRTPDPTTPVGSVGSTATGAAGATSSTTTTTILPASTTTSTLPTPPIPGPTSLTVIGREGWTDRPRGSFRRHRIERITVHHTASYMADNRRAPRLMRQHLDWHLAHDWPDIAYHFVLDRNGNVFEGRPVWAVGDTFTEYDPTGHFLACLEGDLDRQDPSDLQLAALSSLVAWAMQTHRVPPEAVSGHRDWAKTTCPGRNMYWRLAGMARSATDSAKVELSYLDGDDARRAVEAIAAGR